MQVLWKKLTLDSFGRIGLGVILDSLFNSNNQFNKDYDYCIDEFGNRFRFPYRFHTEKQYNDACNRINTYVNTLMEERKKTNYEGRSDLLSLLLQSGQSSDFIRDSLINFIIAGRDTTASLLTWTTYYLETNPEVKQKLIEEIDTHIGEREPTFDDIKLLKYLRNILNEVLRLRPPALPITCKSAVKDDILPNGIKVKAGQDIMYSPYVIHRLHWGNDPEKFDPDRWENPVSLKSPYTFIPFQRGPRQCLGINMSYEEASIVLIRLLQSKLKFTLEPGQRAVSVKGVPIISTIRGGLWLKVKN